MAKRANITLRGNLHWHCGRKLFMRTCAENGINQWNAKMMCGKAVEKSVETYINGVQLREDFRKVSNVLRVKKVNGNMKVTRLEEMVNQIAEAFARVLAEQLKKDGVMMFKPNEQLTPMEIIQRYLMTIEKEKEEKMA